MIQWYAYSYVYIYSAFVCILCFQDYKFSEKYGTPDIKRNVMTGAFEWLSSGAIKAGSIYKISVRCILTANITIWEAVSRTPCFCAEIITLNLINNTHPSAFVVYH